MSQPLYQPSVTALLLENVIAAIADRPGLSHEQKVVRAGDALKLVEAFMPRDAVQILLVGQVVLFNHLLGDGARDVLRGMQDTLKSRAQSNINGMNRSLHQNLRPFLQMRGIPAAAARAAPAVDPGETAQSRVAAGDAATVAQVPDPGSDRAADSRTAPPARMTNAGTPQAAADSRTAPPARMTNAGTPQAAADSRTAPPARMTNAGTPQAAVIPPRTAATPPQAAVIPPRGGATPPQAAMPSHVPNRAALSAATSLSTAAPPPFDAIRMREPASAKPPIGLPHRFAAQSASIEAKTSAKPARLPALTGTSYPAR